MLCLAAALLIGDVEDLFRDLRTGDIEARTLAAAELRALMPEIAPQLRERLALGDPEERSRLLEILHRGPRLNPAIGKVAFVDAERRRFAGDLRARDGTTEGLVLDIGRNHRRIGSVRVVEVHPWGSWMDLADGEPPLRGDTLHPR